MRVIIPGHVFELDHLDGYGKSILSFVNRNQSHECEGTTNQEVIRALISRVQFLDSQIHWPLNEQIINHLRMAIALHEARALIRKQEKGYLNIEEFQVGCDRHLIITPDQLRRGGRDGR